MASKNQTTRARIFLPAEARKSIAKYYPAVAASLEQHFAFDGQAAAADIALAETIGTALESVQHSSDTECEYFPCVIFDVDVADDQAFFGALGIDPEAQVKVGGVPHDKLAVRKQSGKGQKTPPTIGLLTQLRENELEELDEYIEAGDQAVYAKAAELLEKSGAVVGFVLCADDGATKLVVTVTSSAAGGWPGVLTCRVET